MQIHREITNVINAAAENQAKLSISIRPHLHGPADSEWAVCLCGLRGQMPQRPCE